MADGSKKRNNSFRRLFPFFSKTKDKHPKGSQAKLKEKTENLFSNNQYHDTRVISARDKINREIDNDERIYENFTVNHELSDDIQSNGVLSDHSSSSTLVSESVKNRTSNDNSVVSAYLRYKIYSAGPQVPSRPFNDSSKRQNSYVSHTSRYPDVYYHSIEKKYDRSPPADHSSVAITTQQSSPVVNPTSVGAEIKKVSTKFLISPKKEAEVRTIQPTKARSLSFSYNGNKKLNSELVSENAVREVYMNKDLPKRTYNYSAPTSPVPINNKIPIMPKTVSPYGHVRRNMIESEERSNSLGRLTSPSNNSSNQETKISAPISKDTKDAFNKEKTRQKVEAFYWHKLKEMKEKEDEFYLKQALNTSANKFPVKACSSTPSSLNVETRSYSLPRGVEFQTYCQNQPRYPNNFVRGIPERRTDSFITKRHTQRDEVLQRNLQKTVLSSTSTDAQPSQEQKLNPINDFKNHQIKRVSFEEHLSNNGTLDDSGSYVGIGKDPNDGRTQNESNSNFNAACNPKVLLKAPPRPPVRTTSFTKTCIGVKNKKNVGYSVYSESESGSEASEIQRIMQNNFNREEDWHGDGSRIDGGCSDGEAGRAPSRGKSSRRDDPRRHTLAGNHLYVHTHHPAQMGSMDMEPPLPRGYAPSSNAMLFDDDPGIMSEVETASTGFRRGGKQRSSLPVVRTPSKTLERPLGLVFLQFRSETKRALLPNEITSIDTVKALFVRSFPKQLSMQYMDSPMVKIYIHDSSKDMFYELEDVRAHLRDIRDRSVLRLFEATDITGGIFPGALGAGSIVIPSGVTNSNCSGPTSWDQDQSYFSEPEIDSEYHHQHVHKSKVKPPAYYMGTGTPSTLPRGGGSMLRAFSPGAPPVPAERVKNIPGAAHASDGYMSSPERGPSRVPYEDPYYTQYLGPAAGRPPIAPIIDEEAGDGVIIDDSYQMYGVNPMATGPRPMPRAPYDARIGPPVDEMQRLRVEKMERQLANLTGLVQKALQAPGQGAPPLSPHPDFQAYVTRPNQDAARFSSSERPPKLGRDKFQKSVSFEKSVSFSDEPPDLNSPKQHSPQHSADTKPTKPAIKSSTLPRTSSQERDRLKPAPPPKPAGLAGQQMAMVSQRTYTLNVSPEFFGQMRVLQKQSRDLRIEARNLRRSTLSHAMQMRQMMADAIVQIGNLAASACHQDSESLSREEEIYRQDMLLLENDLYELEATVERLRGQAANRETRVNMGDIERIAMVLSKSSKTVADWKLKFPILQNTMKIKLASEMEKVVRKEKLLEEEPERLELALRRCKKLTGTLVTLKRLACVQEQRLPISDGRVSPGSSSSTFTGNSSEEFTSESTCHFPDGHNKGGGPRAGAERGENALDALLDELQTFARPAPAPREPPLRRLHSYPSGSDTDASPPVRARGHRPAKPPVPERHPELLAMAARRAPPPPPPRTTSRSPLASPTSPSSPPDEDKARQLEQRHQDLLKKQRALQEQYVRLQMIQRSGPALPASAQPGDLKKTGSESNLLTKMNLNLSPAVSGSMTHLPDKPPPAAAAPAEPAAATVNKVYETDIL